MISTKNATRRQQYQAPGECVHLKLILVLALCWPNTAAIKQRPGQQKPWRCMVKICCCTVGRNCFRRPCPPHDMHAMQILASKARLPTAAVAAMHHTIAVAAAGILTRPLLLVSDLDDTLVQHTHNVPGANAASAALKAIWERSRDAGVHCKLAINTGRTLPLFEVAWKSKQALLPQPDALIAAVGTRCYQWHAGGWVEDGEWTAAMSEGWDPPSAKAVIDGLISTFGEANVEYRPEIELHEHKLTVLYRKALREQVMPHLHHSLEQAGVQATVIEGGAGRGPEWQFIDLLPAQAGKGKAMLHMQQKLGFADASTVAAGDANNDMLMLQEAPRSILVGNASPELKDWARQQQAQRQEQLGGDRRGQSSMFIATEPIAAGVMEGLRAFGMLSMQLPD